MIVITGGSDGLGKALVKLYKQEGKTVINISRSSNKDADYNFETDLRSEESVNIATTQVLDISEKLEAIINAAGVLSIEELESITGEELDRIFQTNVKGPILLISKLASRIKDDGTDIVNVASTVGTKGYFSQAAYGASKWAIRGFSANLQAELKDYPCRVISFCPGGFKTKLFEKATGIDNTGDGSEWMKAQDVAQCLKQLLDLPKNMEVSEVIINRKSAR